MPRRIPDEKREEIIRLYDNGGGMSPAEIARQTGVSYSSVYGLTKVRQRTNPETGKPFESISQYKDYQARQRTNPETGKPFESLSQLLNYQARQRTNPETGKPFESRSQYNDYQARQRTNPETRKPFESISQYAKHMMGQRQEALENQALSHVIKTGLEELEQTQSWLAREIGVSREAVSQYAQGKCIPHDEVLERIFSALELPYHTLDDLLEDSGIEL